MLLLIWEKCFNSVNNISEAFCIWRVPLPLLHGRQGFEGRTEGKRSLSVPPPPPRGSRYQFARPPQWALGLGAQTGSPCGDKGSATPRDAPEWRCKPSSFIHSWLQPVYTYASHVLEICCHSPVLPELLCLCFPRAGSTCPWPRLPPEL